MKSPLNILLMVATLVTLGATVAHADPEGADRRYLERHNHYRFEGTESANRGNDYRDHRPEWQGRESERAHWNDYREHHSDWRGHDSDRARWNDDRDHHSEQNWHQVDKARWNDYRDHRPKQNWRDFNKG